MSTLIDLTGQRFTRLLVIRRSQRRKSSSSHLWECLCDCGKTTHSDGLLLRNGGAKSCGCLRMERFASRRIDISGLRVGRLVAIAACDRPAGVNKGNYWRCKCDCGGEAVVRANAFKFGQVNSCGCLHSARKKKTNDLTGKRFGKLLVLDRLPRDRRSKHARYKCLCECGAITTPMGKDLTFGSTTSCGCARTAAIAENAMELMFRFALVPMRHGDAIARDAA